MAQVTQTQLTVGFNSSAGQTSNNTASISPATKNLILVSVTSKIASNDPNVPSVSGCGLTWTSVSSLLQTGNQHVRVTVFRALSQSSITPGALTISFGGQGQDSSAWEVHQFGNVLSDASNGANTIVQVKTATAGGTTPSVSFSTFAKNANAAVGVVGSLSLGTTYTPGGGSSQIWSQTSAEVITAGSFLAQATTAVSWTENTTTYPTAAIGLELAFQPPFLGGGMI